ncbi:MAG: ATP-binding protein [Bacteroidales bacterium]
MTSGARARARFGSQFRPTVAKLQKRLTLRIRLAALVALVVSLVVGFSAYLQIRSFENSASERLIDTARLTAQAVSETIEVQERANINPDDIGDIIRGFSDADPYLIRRITIVVLDPSTHAPSVYASTSSYERDEALRIAKRAFETKAEAWGNPEEVLQTVALPVYSETETIGAVAVTVSLASAQQMHQTARTIVFWFVPPAIIALTLLVDLVARRMIHKPIGGIRGTMSRVAAGDLSARAPVMRHDEIGEVAEGLNEMLTEMENFNVALQAKIREATEELRTSNAELVDSYKRMFALREALARAEQMAAVGQTAASVAHQIGTPLNLISGYVQMLMEEAGEDSRSSRRLEIVQEQISKVTTIVRTMLDHARRPMPRQETSVTQMVERVCEVARPKLDAMGVQLAVAMDQDVPLLTADTVQLELALLNLITNSLDAMPNGGTLAIHVAARPSGVRIEVADTGTGIAADLLPRVFDPWVTTKSAGHGSGLGLSITREVVASHGGTITVASESGAGATFTIDLPANGGAAAAAVAGTAASGPSRVNREPTPPAALSPEP